MFPGCCCIANRHIGARERRQLIPHVRFQVPFLGPESQLKSGFACAGLLCRRLFNFEVHIADMGTDEGPGGLLTSRAHVAGVGTDEARVENFKGMSGMVQGNGGLHS